MKRQTKKFLYNIFSPKRALFAVFLAVLVFGFSVNVSFAATYTDNQKSILETTYGLSTDQIKNLENKNVSYNDFEKKVTDLQSSGSTWTAASAATSVYNESIGSGDVVSDSLNQFRGKAALRGLADGLSEVVLAVVIGVLAVIAAFCTSFVEFGAKVLDFTLNPSLYNFTSNTMIVQGWTMVRDICNLFFLLVLLFIAMCTILKIEKYHAKKTLLTLIIMALLINFSKPIAVFIFDGSQLLMNFFLSQMGQTGTGQTTSTVVAKATQIADLVYKSLPGYWGSDDTSLNIAVQYLFAVVFLFMLGVAFFVTALMLIIRIVVIMLLIIVSPFAFFAAIIPDFSKMSSQWWSSLFEYSYYGPAAAFFLLLATQLDNALPHLTNSETASQFSAQNFNTTINNIIHYLVVLIFLYASIFMAKKFGGAAGAAIVGNANRFMKWGAGMTKTGGVWGAGARVTGAADVYKGVKQGIGKQPYWRVLTKEGREARSKERQGRWSKGLAPFDIADARKGSEERKNDSEANIRRDAASGDPAAILQGLGRGGGLANDLMTDPRYNRQVLQMLDQHPELRNAAYKSLRDNGQHHLQVANETRRTIGAPGAVNRAAMNTITEGMFRNSSPNDIFSNPDVYSILDEEGGRGGDYLLDRLGTMTDDTMLQRMRMNVKNPQSSRVLDNLIDWRQTHPAVGGVYPPPPRAYLLR